MTKAERAELAMWKRRAALSWPTFERPTPVSIEEIRRDADAPSGVFRGWWVNMNHPDILGEGVVVGGNHAREPYTDEQIAGRYGGRGRVISLSQGIGGPWFLNKADALKESAWRTAELAAEKLDRAYELLREAST